MFETTETQKVQVQVSAEYYDGVAAGYSVAIQGEARERDE